MSKKVSNEFIQKINKVYKECVGYEIFGETTEFFDESGCILMSITENGHGKLEFLFTDSGDFYNYSAQAN